MCSLSGQYSNGFNVETVSLGSNDPDDKLFVITKGLIQLCRIKNVGGTVELSKNIKLLSDEEFESFKIILAAATTGEFVSTR